MNIKTDYCFDMIDGDSRSSVFEVFPSVFGDLRGWFCETYKSDDETPLGLDWFKNMAWVRQINRSSSTAGVIRGFHAQSGEFCQAKLVTALTETIYDVIIDARPDSKTFGQRKIYKLDPALQNLLFVPRGFLHGFVVPVSAKTPALFEYYCDNIYEKTSEIRISPVSMISDLAKWFDTEGDYDTASFLLNNAVLSDKDIAAADPVEWMSAVADRYNIDEKLWYR